MSHNVLVLQIYTTVDLELVKNTLASLLQQIGPWKRWIQAHRLQSFVVVTRETPDELRRRLYEAIVDRAGIGGMYCFTAPDDLVGFYGDMEGLRFHIDRARQIARDWDKPKNMGQAQHRRFLPKRQA